MSDKSWGSFVSDIPADVIHSLLGMSEFSVEDLTETTIPTKQDDDPPKTLAFRLSTSSNSVIFKKHSGHHAFQIESKNLEFLRTILPNAVPTVLFKDEDKNVLLLEDVGDLAPLPSDRDNCSESTVSTWRSIMRSIAEVHHSASDSQPLQRSLYSGTWPRRSFMSPNTLSSALLAGCRHYCNGHDLCFDSSAKSLLARRLAENIAILEDYRKRFNPYVMGERSSRNIRLFGKRIVHIDHCELPGYVSPADLVSIWRSPQRSLLVHTYVEHRAQLDSNFDQRAFYLCDHAFTSYNCILWCGLRARTLRDPKARIPPASQNPVPAIAENLSTAIHAASHLGHQPFANTLTRLLDALTNTLAI